MNRKRSRGPAVPPPTPTLSALIAQRRNELRMSFKTMAEIGQAAGFQVTEAGLYSLVNRDWRAVPHPDTLGALAAALELPVSDLYLAAGRELGLVVSTDSGQRVAAAVADLAKDLDDSQVEPFLDAVRSLRRLMQSANPADQADPARPGMPAAGEAGTAEAT